jgi:hypothetical protein
MKRGALRIKPWLLRAPEGGFRHRLGLDRRAESSGGPTSMPGGGKENAPPGGAAEKKDEKKTAGEKADEHGHGHGDDGIGPGNEKDGIAEIGWHLPCACTVLGGIHSTSSFACV